jgi:hypothetical protein
MALALNAYLPDACIVLAERPQISACQLQEALLVAVTGSQVTLRLATSF